MDVRLRRGQGCCFLSPRSPALRKVDSSVFTRSPSYWKQEDFSRRSFMGHPEEDRKQWAEEPKSRVRLPLSARLCN